MPSTKHLHIVSFDVPLPANYGGVIDVFYRIKALHELGVKITLHCFQYGREQNHSLENYCEKVYYYPRKNAVLSQLSLIPHIVKSRSSKKLLSRLLSDAVPILFEGLHTTFWLNDPRLQNRIKLVRTHNIEHDYYHALSKRSSGIKKWYYLMEAKKLHRYEKRLRIADHILAIQAQEADHFRSFHPNVHVLPASIPDTTTPFNASTDRYCLYHGNLSVNENEAGVLWLAKHVFHKYPERFIVAGSRPSNTVKTLQSETLQVIDSPSEETLELLLENARVHVFYSDQPTGLKLKIIRALQTSGHVLVNPHLVSGTPLAEVCAIVSTPEEFRSELDKMLEHPLSESAYNDRVQFLKKHYSNTQNCSLIRSLI